MPKPRILVVEDEFVTATDIQGRLAGMGYEVPAVVNNGEEAVRRAGELRPSLVLMDIGLAGRMNGIEAGKQIRERFGIPVIYLTGHSDDSTFWAALESEPDGYILKPFETKAMKYSIEMALSRHAAGAEGAPGPGGKPGSPGRGLKKAALVLLLLCVAGIIIFIAIHAAGLFPATSYERNVEAVREIARDYRSTHTYLGVETGQPADVYVCIDMAKDVWNIIKTRGINAVIEVGNVRKNVTGMDDVDHAWVLAEVAPMRWIAVETTSGTVVTRDENPRYFTGLQFNDPAGLKEYSCGTGYCWSKTCVDNRCQACSAGNVLGTDLQCHPACGSAYCTGNSVCTGDRCLSCDPGSVVGTDNRCHPTCIDASHYCLDGFTCGPDNACHPV